MTKEKLIQLPIDKEHHIALWKTTSNNSKEEKNILLTHGTFSNKKVCSGIADYLVTKGYICWIMEWRNHGESSKTKHPFNFETIAKEDLKITLDYLTYQLKIPNLDCITHSGGGICLTITLIENPAFCSKIKSITMFGCQAFGAANNKANFLKIYSGKMLSRILGYVPASKTGSPHDESYHTMKQWFNWNLSKQFVGEHGKNYFSEMNKIKIPILSISGGGDKLIAPKSGCESFLAAFENPKNKLLHCSKADGFLEDYSHSRVLHSKNASKEIYPLVYDWIKKRYSQMN